MNSKQHFLAKAAEYHAEAQRSIATAHILNDWTNYERAMEESRTYAWLATLNPQTRAAWIRRNWGSK